MMYSFQPLEYQYILVDKEHLGHNKEHSIPIKLKS